MAVNRQLNTLGQMRVDVPHLRLIESAICYDFDAVGLLITGGVPCVVKGFDVVNYATAVGSAATDLIIKTAGARLVHPAASDSGSFFQVPLSRPNETLNKINGRIQGSWSPNTANYVGIDLLRSADSTTSESARFLNTVPNTESSKTVPLGRTMDYVITISNQPFSGSPSIAPLYIVQTDATNTIVTLKDARNLLFRNGAGGDSPTSNQPFGWPGGRNEANPALTTIAGDRSILSFKQWLNAAMTRFQELGGGEYWYSLTADRNVQMTQGSTVFASNGEAFEWNGSNLHWQGIGFIFDNSTARINAVADQLGDQPGVTDLADGECIYVDLDRVVNETGGNALTAKKGVLNTLGGSAIPGQRWTIASRSGNKIYVRDQPYPVGSAFKLASTTVAGMIRTTINANGDISDPIAVGLAKSDSLGNTATCGGVSHNKDNTSTTMLNAGDIIIGRGITGGDHNVIVQTSAGYGTVVESTGTTPYFDIRTSGGMPYGSPEVNATPFSIQAQTHYDGTKAWTLQGIATLPKPPVVDGGGNIHIKYFAKQTKVWKTPCNYLDNVTAWVYSDPTRIVAPATGAYSVDGHNPSVGDRILVNNPSNLMNGIYTVNVAGGTGVYAVLTRAIDAGGIGSNQYLGYGYDLYDGCAVKITAGTSYTGLHFVLRTTPQAGRPALDGTEANTWQFTDNMTADQMCVMFSDGSYTVMATGPEYAVT